MRPAAIYQVAPMAPNRIHISPCDLWSQYRMHIFVVRRWQFDEDPICGRSATASGRCRGNDLRRSRMVGGPIWSRQIERLQTVQSVLSIECRDRRSRFVNEPSSPSAFPADGLTPAV